MCIAAIALWALIQVIYCETFIYHDLWRGGFPVTFKLGAEGSCAGLAHWIESVDSGSPMMIYIMNSSLTHIFRLATLYLAGCLRPALTTAIYLTKFQVTLSYLAFSGSMFILGCALFQQRLAAVYLFVATLYAGLFLDVMHSDQVVSILFWMPWVVTCMVLAYRHGLSTRAGWYLNGAVIFLCIEALDQYPHFPLLAAAVGLTVAALLWPRESWRLVRRHARCLWPAAIIVLITVFQLIEIRETVMAYQPGQNRGLIVNPTSFGETGFVQPTALFGSFLPLGFLAGFDKLASGMARWIEIHRWFAPRRGFVFKLDILLFNLGFISTVLGVAFATRPGMRRVRAWWIVTAAVMFLVSLQQSRLYLVLFYVPFFDVFRAYFLYITFVVMAALVMSGYGMDAYLTLSAKDRRRLFERSIVIVGGMTALCILCLAWFVWQKGPGGVWSSAMLRYAVVDVTVATGSIVLMSWARKARAPKRWAAILIGGLALTQAIYFVGVYRLVGMSLANVVATYGLDAEDLATLPIEVARDPNRFRRKLCTSFTECYASIRDTATVVRFEGEWRGAFWRSKDDAIFLATAKPPVVAALSGVTHPVFWLSREAVPYHKPPELVERLNERSDWISEYLRQAVGVQTNELEVLNIRTPAGGRSSLTSLQRGRDHFWLTYETDSPVILNAAVTYDGHWVAHVNGTRTTIVRANFNGLAVPLPQGSGTVELAYESWASFAVFTSRYLVLLVAVGMVVSLIVPALGRREENATGDMDLEEIGSSPTFDSPPRRG